MKITYIHHSGVSVETEHAVLLFDYFKGQLPAWDEKKPLFVFASHFHEDHYSPVIFELLEDREDVHYILSKDIRGRRIPPRAEEKIRFVKPGEVFASAADREGITLRVQTYKSTDEGVAFWVTADGQEIYHAGDLNNWWWEGEDKAWNHNMAANYRREVEKNRCRSPGRSRCCIYPSGSPAGAVVLPGNGRFPAPGKGRDCISDSLLERLYSCKNAQRASLQRAVPQQD